MELKEYYSKRRESLRVSLAKERTIDHAEKTLDSFFDRLLYTYNEDAKPEMAEAAAHMVAVAKAAVPLIACGSETKVWETRAGGSDSKKTVPRKSLIALIVGLAAIAYAVIAFSAGYTGGRVFLHYPAILVGMVAVYLSGLWFKNGNPGITGKETRVEVGTDPDRIVRIVESVILTMDQKLQECSDRSDWELSKTGDSKRESYDMAEAELMQNLLEAGKTGDGEYALEKIEDVKFYLHKKGVEAVDDDGSHPDWFDKMPAGSKGTIRPALVVSGKLLKKGLSAEGVK